ncbi:fatty acid desaturase [Mesorhizobium sp. WSM4976]|uniref:fatty acid desaturase n=1 Tax=Mesorhizobium sp. WSM4976 TaxID=3038549 RepID=UPI002417E0D7|nr:fatty acid desaturase [Mesorhizobium sp. WSM4976]MDG4898452.1 fatty acid desaturase [Mesorhizobium sp. WSM4976]
MAAVTSTVRQEAEIGRRHTPDFGGRTLFLEGSLLVIFTLSTAFAVAGAIPIWAAFFCNLVVLYSLYTVVHEAVHSNISSRRKSLRWIDPVAGVIACAPLWLNYHQHKRQHMAHHSHTNHDEDPDIYARGSFLGWVFLRLPYALLNYFNPVQQYRQCKRFNCTPREVVYTAASFSVYAAILIASLAAGFWREVLFLWFIPWWIGQTVMLTFFTWTPHHDHHEIGRYRNSRVSIFPGANFLLQGQNYHLIHHMIPSIPYYRYRASFEEMRPILERKGVRIEGFWPRANGRRK